MGVAGLLFYHFHLHLVHTDQVSFPRSSSSACPPIQSHVANFNLQMALGDFGINLTGDKGTNDTDISTVNPCTEDYNYTSSPNQKAFMGDPHPQGQTIWLPITIAVAVVVVIGLFVIGVIIVAKKRKCFRGKIGLIGGLRRVRGSISRYFNRHGHPEDHLNEMERVPMQLKSNSCHKTTQAKQT